VLKQEIGDYNNVKIEWIRGHAPTAYLKDGTGNVVDTFELQNFDHGEFLELLKSHNFVPLTNEAVFPASPRSSGSFGGHVYEYYETAYLWNDVQRFASSRTNGTRKGYLMTLTSPEEEQFVSSLIPNKSLGVGVWLGAQDTKTEGNWNWIGGPEQDVTFWRGRTGTGKAVEDRYSNWDKNEPNNGDGTSQEDCAYVSLSNGKTSWTDISCFPTSRYSMVVEYGDELIVVTPTTVVDNDNNSTIHEPVSISHPSLINSMERLQPVAPKSIFHGLLFLILPLLIFTIGFVLYSVLLNNRKKRDFRAWFSGLLKKWQFQGTSSRRRITLPV